MKKIGSLIVAPVLALSILSFTACSNPDDIGNPITVTDQAGRTVTLPETIERVAIANMPLLTPALIQVLGSTEKIVGMPPNSVQDTAIARRIVPNLDSINTSFYSTGEINVESLALLKPDVVFASTYAADIEILENAGFTVVAFDSQAHGIDALATVSSWYELFGRVFGLNDAASEVKDYNNEIYTSITTKLADINKENMPNVLYIPWYRGTAAWLYTSPNGYAGQYYSETTGASNAGADIGVDDTISVETLALLNPDIIYLGSFNNAISVENFYENELTTSYWSEVNAVMNQKVYKIPGEFCNWFQPSADTALSLLFQATIQHPELFSINDLKDTVKEYYSLFYNVTLTDTEITTILGF